MTTSLLGTRTVRRIGYGAMQLAGPDSFGPPADAEAAVAVLRRAVERGVDHIDTAQYYGPDVVNDLIRKALSPYPESLVIATKVGTVRDAAGAWLPRGEPGELVRQVEENLRSLAVDRLGLVNLRRFERDGIGADEPALEDQLAALVELRDAGKIAAIGVSQVTAEDVPVAVEVAGIVAVQNAYNVLDRAEDAVLDVCRRHSIAFVPYFPLGSGYGVGGPRHLAADPHVRAVAAKHGATVTRVALAWLLARYDRMLLIPGTASVAHLDDNLAADRLALDADDLAALDAVEPVPFDG